MTPTGPLRARAAEAAAEIAGRLADPERTAATAPAWSPLSLDAGHPGLTLLFAELAHHEPALRPAAHAHLAAAAAHLPGPARPGLYHGVPALAFAAHTARQAPQHYAGLLGRLDPVLDAALHRALKEERTRLAQNRAGVPCSRYDLINGVTGLTRLLLARQATHQGALSEALAYLVRLTRPLTLHGRPVPGWWSPAGPDGSPDPAFPRGHVNFGLAHGISGPLAVLSAALLAGASTPGLRRAVSGLAQELLTRRTTGGGWPALIPLERYGTPPPPPGRSAWCYGTPGTACALYRAGQALQRPDLQQTAVDALATDLDHPRRVTDNPLCHGRAGLLLITHTLATSSHDPRLTTHRDTLATQLLTDHAHRPADSPGLLTGTAGIALALHAFATDKPPASGWDSALLLR
ncbi:lanthionine synthetase C family protein [Streptomyces pinistramenti]|uniref:lanthionine synthetase C family protein n=1 Tax=Streptomyces pinistramenti TaxID=2884812 RepID=UPI001D092733|nr:lanthionine synthetase C family protein [Streptomyces pinistramenti]MCB5908612.1 lanthionine synthetase C family protein [Streptomyces pinistramenti]